MNKYHIELKDCKTTEVRAEWYAVEDNFVNFYTSCPMEGNELIASISDYSVVFVKKVIEKPKKNLKVKTVTSAALKPAATYNPRNNDISDLFNIE